MNDIEADADFRAMFPTGLISRKPLDTMPIGFDSDDPAARYLKMVGIGCRKDIPDALLLDDDVIEVLIETFRTTSPLVRHFD